MISGLFFLFVLYTDPQGLTSLRPVREQPFPTLHECFDYARDNQVEQPLCIPQYREGPVPDYGEPQPLANPEYRR
jgi:hypothetical protein